MVQGALMVGHTDPTVSVSQGGMFAPQREFWIGGPITLVNYQQAGALRACADVSFVLLLSFWILCCFCCFALLCNELVCMVGVLFILVVLIYSGCVCLYVVCLPVRWWMALRSLVRQRNRLASRRVHLPLARH
jgi:hypothetical protein